VCRRRSEMLRRSAFRMKRIGGRASNCRARTNPISEKRPEIEISPSQVW
jgi:hypothetical protein